MDCLSQGGTLWFWLEYAWSSWVNHHSDFLDGITSFIFFMERSVSMTQKRSSSLPVLKGFLLPNWQGRGLWKYFHLIGNDNYSFIHSSFNRKWLSFNIVSIFSWIWTQYLLLNNSRLEGVGPPDCKVWLETRAYLQDLGRSRKRWGKSERSGLRWGLEVRIGLSPKDLTTPASLRSKKGTGRDRGITLEK